MKKLLLRFLLILSLILPVALVHAEDPGAVKARMAQRIPEINALKAKGAVGENNHGFLEIRESKDAADTALVAAENKDRETAYTLLADQTKTSFEQVSKARARQIAQGAPAGVWIQDIEGNWKKK